MSGICVKVESLSKRFWVLQTSDMALLGVVKAFIKRQPLKNELWVLKNVSFEIKKGEKIALIGKNGAGKTTLLRILAGILNVTSGYLEVQQSPRALFKYYIGLHGELSVIDNIYLFGAMHGIMRSSLRKKMDEILEFVELRHLQFCPLKELSVGQRQRLTIGVFFQAQSDFLILDESLAFVDQGFAQKCETYFKKLSDSQRTVIMTSHDTSFLKRYCETALWLDSGVIRMHDTIDRVLSAYEHWIQNIGT